MRIALLVAALGSACASTPVQPPAAVHVRYGLNDGFHGPLPAAIVAQEVGYVVRTPQLSGGALDAFLASRPGPTLALIESDETLLAADFARHRVEAIENGNELELPPHNLTPRQYADAQRDMMVAEREAGFTGDIIMGGVYALTADTQQAIRLALSVCGTCLVGVHLYDPSQADVDWLNGLDADIAITETGSPTGCGTAKWQAQADYLAHVRTIALRIRRLKYFVVYQRPSGTGCSNLETFGIEGKPAAALLASWVSP